MKPKAKLNLPDSIVNYVEKLTIGNDQFILVPKEHVDRIVSLASIMFPGCLYVASMSNVPGFIKVSREVRPYHKWHSRTSCDKCHVTDVLGLTIYYEVNTKDGRVENRTDFKTFIYFWMPDQQRD